MPDEQTPQPPTPVAAPVDKLALARDAARKKSESHDINTCLCPYCKGRRKQAGIPQPPKPAVVRQPKHTTAPTPEQPKEVIVAKDVVHDRDSCPCHDCKEWRSERARLAANARYAKQSAEQYDWENQPLPDAEQHLAGMRREIERGAQILHKRYDTSHNADVPCERCGGRIPNGRWVMQKSIRDPETGLVRPIFFCSGGCVNLYSSQVNAAQHGPETGEPTGRHPEQSPKARAEKAFAAANPITVT